MSSRIRVLDEQTINKIAAGEVIENPASVVKELVENALDAEATEICVEIRGGGRQLIRVTDNGHGMNADDALLCLERHATSKMRQIDDLHSLNTMGFRGEAIPSIASISKLTMLTCANENNEGTLVIVDGGRIIKCTPAAKSQGTTIEVKSLFFNVPVRKKFQRSPAYDVNEILKVISFQALAHPSIKFQLISNQKNLLMAHLPKGNSFQEKLGGRIPEVLGSDFFVGMCPAERKHKEYKLSGFIGLPAYTRHNRTGQYVFINERAVFSPLISYAVREGYGPTLPTNRHPVFVLHITMSGSLVDVNVHPQKREVRLRQVRDLREMIIFSVEEALQQTGISTPSTSVAFHETPSFAVAPPPIQSPIPQAPEPPSNWTPSPQQEEETIPNHEPAPLFEQEIAVPEPKVLTTLQGYLLLTSNSGGLKLVDQRAAHSRILYERLMDQEKGTQQIQTQNLLIPYTLDFSRIEAEILKENLDSLNRLGIHIQEFGNQSFIVQAIPQNWVDANIHQLVTDMINELREFHREGVIKKDREKHVALAAGRAAVSQKKLLSLEEGQALIKQLYQCLSPYICPHGKPTMIEITHEEINKQFQR